MTIHKCARANQLRPLLRRITFVLFACLFPTTPALGDDRDGTAAVPWSFQPIVRPALPDTAFGFIAVNAIDRFIFREIDKRRLRVNPLADPHSLLRRVTIDLIGLPPTPEEIEEFLSDKSPLACEKVVDRLLASPAYGERWARDWLDVVRFGESHGYEQNHLRPNAWPYRDYVIDAFNSDKPYPQFIAEQLAGDVESSADKNAVAATGFLVAGVHDTVGIQTVEGTLQQRANDLDDMVSTIGAAFLGLTVGCAKCHDHKFDPIPQRDFYRLAAVVAGVRHGERPLTSMLTENDSVRQAKQQSVHRLSGLIADIDADARTRALRAQGVVPLTRPATEVRRNVDDFSPVMARHVRLNIHATRTGDEPCLDEIEVFGPDRETNLANASRGATVRASSLLPGYAIHQIRHLNDGKYGNDWSWISNEPGRGWVQVTLPTPALLNRVVWSRDSAGDSPRFHDRLVARYTIETSNDGSSWTVVSRSDDRAAAPESFPSATLHAALTAEERQARARLVNQRTALQQTIGANRAPTAYIGQFSAPDPVFVHKRGDVTKRGEVVSPGALSQVPGLSAELGIDNNIGEPARRVALARWIAHSKNPLTARVWVNRIWQHHFGKGIVATPSDFGAGGARPTHPDLLDWLAAEFMEHGWRLKQLQRQIVLSHTYRQSSAASAESLGSDADNRWLGRMSLRRMEAEALRDSVLVMSGLLDRRMGGPGFRLFDYRIVNVAIYEPLAVFSRETHRRGIYQQAARAYRDDLLAGFDCPECAQRTPRRDVTTTPLQALSALNGPFMQQAAAAFAERLVRETGPDLARQVTRAYRLAFGRLPRASELEAACALTKQHGLTSLCRALLNANEFLYY